MDDRAYQKHQLGGYPLMTSSLYYKKARSLLRNRDAFVQHLWEEFLYKESEVTKSTVHTHRQSASFSCQVCSKHFYRIRKDVLKKHMKTHQPTVAAVPPSADAEKPVNDLHNDSLECPPDLASSLPEEPSPKKHREMHLWEEFLFKESYEEAPRVHSSTIWQLFLSSM